jgi:peptidyl-prolyl cis-trans isomerase A (cyclophilin A)
MRPALALPVTALLLGCSSSEPASTNPTDSGVDSFVDDTATAVDSGTDTGADANYPEVSYPDPFADGSGCTRDPGPGSVTFEPSETGDDPIGPESFTLAMALQGFPSEATGKLKAAITTQLGVIVCTFDEQNAPITVANFVGLARGTRPFYDTTGSWVTRRFYDGLKWHRVIFDFVIQGGDPRGTGSGGPGYNLPVENHAPQMLGTISMAAGAAPSGSQFYIVVGRGPAAEYNVFGSCETDVAQAIADVETNTRDAPVVPIHMQRIDIARCP